MWPWKWRKVRTAQISKEDRDLFERYGEAVIGSVLANLTTPTAPELRSINAGSGKVKEARDWLTECRDAHEQREQRLEFVEWAILLFILLEIGLSILSLGHGRGHGIIRGTITGSIVPRAQAALLQQTNPAAVASSTSTAAQKPAPQPTEQQKLKERVDALESSLKELKEKSDDAAKERAYVEKIRSDTKEFYQQAFSSQTQILGITGVILTILVALAGWFGFSIFEQRIQNAVSKATTDLETKFDQKLAQEGANLEKSNAAHLKQLEGSLKERIRNLGKDLDLRGSFSYSFNQGLALAAHGNYPAAQLMFRKALEIYKFGKRRRTFDLPFGKNTMHDLLVNLEHLHGSNVAEEAEKEFAHEVYNDLEVELALAAPEFDWLGPHAHEELEYLRDSTETLGIRADDCCISGWRKPAHCSVRRVKPSIRQPRTLAYDRISIWFGDLGLAGRS